MILKSSFAIHSGQTSGSLSYIAREGAYISGPTPIYDREGHVLDRSEFKELREEILEAPMERRLIFSPRDPELSEEDLSIMVRDVIERYLTDEDKNFEYVFALHNHNQRTHVHVLAYGDKEDLLMDKDALTAIRDMAQELEIEQEKVLEMDKGDLIEKDKSYALELEDRLKDEEYEKS